MFPNTYDGNCQNKFSNDEFPVFIISLRRFHQSIVDL
jgi:hypothetical protein